MAFISPTFLAPGVRRFTCKRMCNISDRVNSAAPTNAPATFPPNHTTMSASVSGGVTDKAAAAAAGPPPKVEELTTETKEIVKSTVPVLKKQGVAIVTRFYPLLFERYPELRYQFNMDRQAKGKRMTEGVPAQVAALSRAVLGYASNIDNPSVLLPTVMYIANKHVSRGVKGSQYDKIGECLIAAIGEVLGDAATESIVKAWTEAYGYLAQLFISIEDEIWNKAAEAAGYEGFTQMEVQRIEENAGEKKGKVIYMLPESGVVPRTSAGQYAAIVVTELAEIGESMLTATVETESTEEFGLTVVDNEEVANTSLLSTVQVGMKLKVGMPCGNFTVN